MLVQPFGYLNEEGNKHDLFEKGCVTAHTASSSTTALRNMFGTG